MSNFDFYLIFHRFSPFNCCLNIVLQLDKGDTGDCVTVLVKSVHLNLCVLLDLKKAVNRGMFVFILFFPIFLKYIFFLH